MFLGFVLSFLYSGLIFTKLSSAYNYKEVYYVILFSATTASCIFMYFFDVKISESGISTLIFIDVALSIVFTYVINGLNGEVYTILSYGVTFIIGFLNVFISNSLLLQAKKYNDYMDIFVNIAVIMAIANVIGHLINVLMTYGFVNLPIILGFFVIIVSAILILRLDLSVSDDVIINEDINIKDLYCVGVLVFLLKLSEGIMYQLVENNILFLKSEFTIVYAVPYFLAIVLCLLISYRINRRMLLFLFVCIGIIGIANVLFLLSEEFLDMGNIILHFGVGVLDVFVWGIIIYLIFIYKKANKIVALIMFSQVLGMFVGYMMYEMKINEYRPAYLIALICLFLAAVLANNVKEMNKEEIFMKKKMIFQKKYMATGLHTKGNGSLDYMEKQIFDLMAGRKDDREILNELNISVMELEAYYESICLKLGASNREELRENSIAKSLI